MQKIISILLTLISLNGFCQKDRYRFAETYFGFEAEYVNETGSFLHFNDGTINTEKLPSQITPRILIGGTHFWRHADFYISIPLSNLHFGGSDQVTLNNDVFTGFRYLPLSLEDNSIRPYIGVGLHSKGFKIESGPSYTN